MRDFKVTGSIIQAYFVCKRQSWLLTHSLIGNKDSDFLVIGKLLSEETFKREKKEIVIDGGKVDFIRIKDGTVKIVEVKKSSKMIKSAKMQLLFYMLKLTQKIPNIKGEIRIPKEKKVIEVELDEKNTKELEKSIDDIYDIINNPIPSAELKGRCNRCSYVDFCFS